MLSNDWTHFTSWFYCSKLFFHYSRNYFEGQLCFFDFWTVPLNSKPVIWKVADILVSFLVKYHIRIDNKWISPSTYWIGHRWAKALDVKSMFYVLVHMKMVLVLKIVKEGLWPPWVGQEGLLGSVQALSWEWETTCFCCEYCFGKSLACVGKRIDAHLLFFINQDEIKLLPHTRSHF